MLFLIRAVVCLITDYDYNFTKSGLDFLNSTKNTIYLGLVLLTSVCLKYVTFG